jgi:hypothetical protein
MRRIISILGTTTLALGLAGLAAPAAPAAASGLPPLLGTGPRVAVRTPTPGTMTRVRIGRHAAFDRVVFTIDGAMPGWDVRYVRRVYADGSGRPVPLSGHAALRVVLHGVNGHDDEGHKTVTGVPTTPRWPALRQVKPAGDLEGVMTFGLGVSDRLDFRVFGLSNPTRVVVDVAHPVTIPFRTGATQIWAPPGGGGDVTLAAIRTGGHPGFDRIVLDLPGARLRPNIGSWYAGPMDDVPPMSGTSAAVITRVWTFSTANAPGDPSVSYPGPREITVGLPNLRTITVRWLDPSNLDVIAGTRVRHGYRTYVVPGTRTTRVVIDIAR